MLVERGVLDAEEEAALENCTSFMLGDIDACECWSDVLGTRVEADTVDLEFGFQNDCLSATIESIDGKHLLLEKLANALFPLDEDMSANDGCAFPTAASTI